VTPCATGIESKKKTYGYRERDELQRLLSRAIEDKVCGQVCTWMKQVSITERSMAAGQLATPMRSSGKAQSTVSWIGTLKQELLLAPMTFVVLATETCLSCGYRVSAATIA